MDGEHALGAAFAQVAGALAAVRAASAGVLNDVSVREGVREMFGLRTQFDHAWLGLVAELDRRPDAVPGARAGAVATSFLSGGLNRTTTQSGRDVAAARALFREGLDDASPLAQVGEAFAAGEISREHVDVAVRAVDGVPRDLLAVVDEHGRTGAQRVDGFLTDQAKVFDPGHLANLARHLNAVLDPDAQDLGYDPDAWRRRHLRLVEHGDGMTSIHGQVDAASAVYVKAALGHFGSWLRSDGACASGANTIASGGPSEVSGQDVLPVDARDDRTPGQRNADALVAGLRKAMHAADAGSTRREPAHVLVVTTAEQLADAHTRPDARQRRAQADADFREQVRAALTPTPGDHEIPPDLGDAARVDRGDRVEQFERVEQFDQFGRAVGLAEIARTGPVSPDVLARITCDSLLQAVVMGHSGQVLDLGRTQRTASRAQRRALAARDRGCIIHGCRVPAADCDAHHLRYWSAGGKTDLTNLALLCERHHTEVHLGIWVLLVRNGIPVARPPDWHHRWWKLDDEDPPDNRHHTAADRARRIAQQLRLDLDPPDTPAA